ncbi:MAG: PAS domain S-box protein [Methanomicrobiales archaeon]
MINWTIRRKMILLLIPAIIAVMSIATVFSLQLSNIEQKEAAYEDTLNLARSNAHEFNTVMSDKLVQSGIFSMVLAQNTGMTREEVIAIQHTLLERNPEAIGIGVIFEPGAFDGLDSRYTNTPGHDPTGRFATYWNRLNGNESLFPVVNIETSDWYLLPEQTHKEVVMEPLLYEGVLMTSYISPIIENQIFKGTVGIDVPLESIDRTVSRLKVLDTGYAFLVSNTGIFVSSPEKNYIGRMTLNELSRMKNNPKLAAMAADIHEGKEGYTEMADPFTGKSVVMFYSPIQTGNWSMVVVAPTNEMLAGVTYLSTVILLIGLLSIVIVGGIVIVVARNLSEPIVAMSRTADRIASGDLDVHVPDQDGELGVLANAFNNMAARLRELIGSLEAKVIELQNTQAALQESEQQYRTILNNIQDVFYRSDRDGNLIMASPSWALLLGYDSVEECIGKNIADIFYQHPENRAHFRETVYRQGSVKDYEVELKKKDGSSLFVSTNSHLYYDKTGAIAGIEGIYRDITERRLLETTLKRVNLKLNVLSELTRKGINSQIFVLNSYVGLALKNKNEPGLIIKWLDDIGNACRELQKIIDYSKDYQDMGMNPPKWQNVQTTMLLGLSHISIGDIRHSLETKDLEIFADPLLEKVCQRLFENSFIHGVHVTQVRVWYTITPSGLTLFFEDDGAGIQVEKKDAIFLRAENTPASSNSLVFMREILDITGITIRETGEPGKGARFEMAVPKGSWRMAGNDE